VTSSQWEPETGDDPLRDILYMLDLPPFLFISAQKGSVRMRPTGRFAAAQAQPRGSAMPGGGIGDLGRRRRVPRREENRPEKVQLKGKTLGKTL
jgi:hypothetical protein